MKVLIVDDEVILGKALKRAFEASGHTVILCESGEDGLSLWEKEAPQLVLLDVAMPILTGPQVIEEFKKRQGDLGQAKIALMTAHSGVKGLSAAKAMGAHDFIQKPFENIFDIVSRLERLVES